MKYRFLTYEDLENYFFISMFQLFSILIFLFSLVLIIYLSYPELLYTSRFGILGMFILSFISWVLTIYWRFRYN